MLVVLLIVNPGCGGDVKERAPAATLAAFRENLLQESWMVKVVLSDSGMERGIVQAAHEEEYRTKKGSKHYLDGKIRVTFFDVTGKATTTITAQRAVIHENQDVEAMGSVIMTSNEGRIIQTEYVKRTAKDNMLRSDSAVTITMDEEIIRGTGFESDQALSKYRIFRGSGEAFIQQ